VARSGDELSDLTAQAMRRQEWDEILQQNEQGIDQYGRPVGVSRPITPGSPAPGHFREGRHVVVAENLDQLTGGSRPITEMTSDARQMTHFPEPYHPDQAIAQAITQLFGGALGHIASIPQRISQASETMRRGGDYDPSATVEGLSMMTPAGAAVAAAPARAVGGLVKSGLEAARAAPKTAAGLAGAVGTLATTEAGEAAGPRLTREQRQQMEMERQRSELEGTQRLQEIEARSVAAKEEATRQAQLSKEAEERHAQAVREEEQHKLDMSFRERHPYLSMVLTGLGWGSSFGLPYLTRIMNTKSTNSFAKEVQKLADDANSAIIDGDVRKASTIINQLAVKEKQAVKLQKEGKLDPKLSKALVGTAMFAPTELGALPEEMDIMFGTDKAKERAKDELSPLTSPLRLPVSIAGGTALGSIGAKAPIQKRMYVPEGSASAARKSLKELRAEKTREKTAATKEAEKEPKEEPQEIKKGKAKVYGIGSKSQAPFGE